MTEHDLSEHTHHQHHEPVDPESIDWNEIYGDEAGGLWSGHVNGSLTSEVASLVPGRALDVGCGEGADALWLAERGWQVTAIDVARVAIDRARAEAANRSTDGITWIAGDLLADDVPVTGPFDLVSLQYPAFPLGRRHELSRVLRALVAAGGTLLVVGHAPPEDPNDAPFDHTQWTQPDDLVCDLTAGWTIERHETVARPGSHHHGSVHSHDVILRARRTA